MSTITVCTFNVENLFGRYRVFGFLPSDQYKRKIFTPEELEEKGGFLPGQMFAPKNSFEIFGDEWRQLTAKALKGNTQNYPDIACLQEVESLRVLRRFNKKHLESVYPHVLLIDGHDPRLIDVGILSKHEIKDVRTHMDEPYGDKSHHLFTRDCLEVTFDINGTPLTLFVNHLKSKYGGAQASEVKRKAQAIKVAEFVNERFKSWSFNNRAFAVIGDFNDIPSSKPLKPLVRDLGLENVIDRIPDKADRWTHWWGSKNRVSQIDYILLSPRLANDSPGKPYIERKGISSKRLTSHLTTADNKKGKKIDFKFERFPEIEKEEKGKIDASDHCPVFFKLKL